MKRNLILLLTILLSFTLLGCVEDNGFDPDKKTVAVTITPQRAFIEAVAGDAFNILVLIPAGQSPATYDPSAKDMAILEDADVYFTIGVTTEDGNILPDPQTSDLYTVALEDIVAEHYTDLRIGETSRDPHIWLSIKRVKIMIETICDELVNIEPTMKDLFEANRDNYLVELDTANATILAKFEDKTMRTFIVFHPSFGYFADDYGLEMISIEEDGKSATQKGIIEIIDFAKEKDIHHVFYQSEFDSSQVNMLKADIPDLQVVELIPLSEDYINNLIEMGDRIAGALS